MFKNIAVMVVMVVSFFALSQTAFAGTDGCYVGCQQERPRIVQPVVKRTTVVKRYYMNGTDVEARKRLDSVEGLASTLKSQMANKANTADVNAAFADTNGRIDHVENRVSAIESWWTLSPAGWFLLFLAGALLVAAIIGGYFFPRNGGVGNGNGVGHHAPPHYPNGYLVIPPPAYPAPAHVAPAPVVPPAPPSINVPLNVSVTPIDIELTPRIRDRN